MLKTVSCVVIVAAGCLGIWLLTLSSVSGEELLVGSLSALATGCVAVAVKRASKVRWSVCAIPVRPSSACRSPWSVTRCRCWYGRFRARAIRRRWSPRPAPAG